jgi:DNA repair protein RecO (recombination protein O)
MPARVSETFVLRTYPFGEADLIVSFFTRDQGKLRGAAKRARRPKSPFGAGLERLSHVRMAYIQRENAELTTLTGCELIDSPFDMQSDYASSLALDFFTEVYELILPPHEVNEKYFRLLSSVVETLRSQVAAKDTGAPWAAVTYLSLWAVRLGGYLPDIRVNAETAEIAEEMFAKPLHALTPREWTKTTAAELRRPLVRAMEQHAERRFLTIPMLEAL